MPTPFALPAVTHVLRHLLLNAQPDDAASALSDDKGWQVSTVAPDLVLRGPNESSSLNLFLYRVAPNLSWRNHDVRTHDAAGNRVAAPPLALDLHYLLTAYGTKDYQAETLLGHAMLALHDHPVLIRDVIMEAFDPDVSIEALMGASGLDTQIETMRISLEALDADGMERVWAGLQLAWRPSVSYLVTVLLLSSKAQARAAPPTRARTITTVPLSRPVIHRVAALADQFAPIEPGTVIAIDGARLLGEATAVMVGSTDLAGMVDEDADGYPDRLTIALPNPLPAGMLTGTRGVQIRHGVRIGGDTIPTPLVDSNIEAIALHPRITSAANVADADGGRGIAVTFAHDIGDRQKVEIILDRIVAGKVSGRGITLPVPDGNFDVPPSGNGTHANPRANLRKLWVPVTAAPVAGAYALRVTVDGLAAAPRTVAASVKVTLP